MAHTKRHARRKIPPDRDTGGSSEPTPDVVVGDGESIQSAIDSAGPSDVIGIEPGTFREQVVVDEDVTLLGAGGGGTTISAPGDLGARFEDGNAREVRPVVSLEADGAALRNLTVAGDGRRRVPGRFVGVAGHEASVYVGDVEVTGVSEATDGQRGSGILVCNRDDDRERLVYVERCDVREYGDFGVVGEGAGLDFLVKESLVAGSWSSQTDVRDGILARDAPRVTLVGNTVAGNHHAGSTIAVGIGLSRTEDALVAWNVIEGNGCGVGAKHAGDIVARQNNIQSNVLGVVDRGSTTFDATNNWWGAEDGPSATEAREGVATDPETGAAADGSGDAAHDVRWDPYSTSPFSLGSAGPPVGADACSLPDEGERR